MSLPERLPPSILGGDPFNQFRYLYRFMMAFIPGLLVSHPRNWKAVAWWGGIVGTLVVALFVGGWIALMGFAPFMTLFTSVLIADIPPNLILAPIVCLWLYRRVQARGLYWRDRLEGTAQAAPARL